MGGGRGYDGQADVSGGVEIKIPRLNDPALEFYDTSYPVYGAARHKRGIVSPVIFSFILEGATRYL